MIFCIYIFNQTDVVTKQKFGPGFASFIPLFLYFPHKQAPAVTFQSNLHKIYQLQQTTHLARVTAVIANVAVHPRHLGEQRLQRLLGLLQPGPQQLDLQVS